MGRGLTEPLTGTFTSYTQEPWKGSVTLQSLSLSFPPPGKTPGSGGAPDSQRAEYVSGTGNKAMSRKEKPACVRLKL